MKEWKDEEHKEYKVLYPKLDIKLLPLLEEIYYSRKIFYGL